MGQATVEHLAGIRRVKRRLGEESPGGGGADIPAPGSGIFFHCGWIGEESAVPPPARVELSVTEFLPVAGEFGVEMRASGLVSEPQAMASYPVVAELEVDQWPVRRTIQFQGAAFPDAAVGSEPHSSALSEDQVELAWLCHSSRLCGHGAAA